MVVTIPLMWLNESNNNTSPQGLKVGYFLDLLARGKGGQPLCTASHLCNHMEHAADEGSWQEVHADGIESLPLETCSLSWPSRACGGAAAD